MPLARTADLIATAYRAGTGVLACNVITLEHAEAIVTGAEHVGRPVILQLSENAVKFHHGRLAPIAAAAAAVADAATVDVAVHLDHVEDERLLHACAGTGASSVMFDASALEYSANVAATKSAAQWAHRESLFLEAELGEVGGKDGAHAPGVRTDPGEAAEFVAATGVDALAVAVGSSHAMAQRSAAWISSSSDGSEPQCRFPLCCMDLQASPTANSAGPSRRESPRSMWARCSTSGSRPRCATIWPPTRTSTIRAAISRPHARRSPWRWPR